MHGENYPSILCKGASNNSISFVGESDLVGTALSHMGLAKEGILTLSRSSRVLDAMKG